MADQSITQLPVATTINGDEQTVVVQRGVTKQASVSQIANAVSPGKLITNVSLDGANNLVFYYSDGTTSITGPIPGYVSATINGSGHLILTSTTGATTDCGNVVGPQGVGVPTGGTTGQILYKTSNADYATGWENVPSLGVTSVTGTLPISSSGGTTPNISISQASSTTNGYLTSTDWNTFNNKQPSGTYVNSVSGTVGRISSTGGTTPVIDLTSGIVTAGTTGSALLIPVITVDTYGRVTNVATASNPQGTVTSVSGAGSVNGITLTGTVTSSGSLTLGGTLSGIGNSQLTNSSITINGNVTALGGSVNVGTVTSVAATAGTGISVTGSPITSSGTLNITNTAPDQIVALTSGTGISVTGTYPNFTVTNTSPSSGGTVTSVTGTAPISVATGTTTPAISLASGYGDTQNPYASKTANYVLAAPNGSAGVPSFRALATADVTGLGTMSTQNANAVAITGGTIDNTVIGGTTPAAGTFTTITGQTEVLRGTGQNYFTNSNGFSTGWSPTFATVSTASSIIDPFGGTSTWNLTEDTTTVSHYITKAFTAFVGLPYVTSIYAKANTRNFIVINLFDTTNRRAWFNLSTGAVGTTDSGVTASIQSIGNGWYRCSTLTYPTSSSTFATFAIASADNTYTYLGNGSGIYIYGAQLELSATVGTYTATTSTAIFNSPNLSFSNAATIGLQSDGSLYVSPAGTGALQAQKTDSTATGGNARGANSVDWQTIRSAATQVASGQYSVIGGGYGQTASNFESAVFSGQLNSVTSLAGCILGGQANLVSGSNSSIVGGSSNTTAGYYNFVGGGFTNSGTASAAVTTQSGTMNGTTAVTLSGSNASIKVGQYITGTSIASDTYVAAISGTALTLSKVASGSSTSTLSFYTPHGVVVGGGNNQATGSYSFIGGGGDAGTAANRNVASGDWSTVAGGWKNVASGYGAVISGGGLFGVGQGGGNTANGAGSTISGGSNHTASGFLSTVAGGYANNATQNGSVVTGGWSNTATSAYGTVNGGNLGTTRAITGYSVFPSCSTPISSSVGVSQASLLVLAKETTNATPTVLLSDANAAGGTNQVILPNNSAYYFTGEVISGVTGGGNSKGWTISGVIKRGANAGATTLVGSTVTSLYADAGAATWTIGLTADTTNGGLAVTFTGQAATTIRTVCQIRTTEMTY